MSHVGTQQALWSASDRVVILSLLRSSAGMPTESGMGDLGRSITAATSAELAREGVPYRLSGRASWKLLPGLLAHMGIS